MIGLGLSPCLRLASSVLVSGPAGPGIKITTENESAILLEDGDFLSTENASDGGNLVTLSVDPAVDLDTAPVTQLAFGFDQLVKNYTDNTVTLRRASDGDQMAFGQDPSGLFDLATVEGWAAGSDVTIVDFIDQKGTGKRLTANGTIYLLQSGSVKRLGATWSAVDGQLTPSATLGGICVEVSGGTYFTLSNSGITASSGMEVHMLANTIDRKIPSTAPSTEPAGLNGNNTNECYFSYGLSTTNYLSFEVGGGNFIHRLRRNGTGGGGTDQSLSVSTPIIKARAQHIFSCRLDDGQISHYSHGARLLNATPSAGNITANASFSNGTFRIGRRYPGSGSESTVVGKMLFGGVIVTQTLTDFRRFKLQSRLTLLANQHLAMNKADLEALFDEIIDFRDIDTGTGLIAGRKGKTSLQVNLASTQYGMTPDWTLQNVITAWGLTGLKNNNEANYASTFTATNNYFSDVNTGTVMAVGWREVGGDLCQWFMNGTSNHSTAPPTMNSYTQNFALGMGFHHSQPSVYRRVAATKDTNDLTGHEGWTDNDGGKVSQAMLKYLFNLAHGDWTANKVTVASVTVENKAFGSNTIASGTTLTTAGIAAVSPVGPPTPENATYDTAGIKFPMDDSFLQFHAFSFKAPAAYNPADSQAVRENYMRQATNRSFVSALVGCTIGHMDCSVALEEGNGAVVHSDPAAKIQSAGYLSNLQGTRNWMGFIKSDKTMLECQQGQVNLYKLFVEA